MYPAITVLSVKTRTEYV